MRNLLNVSPLLQLEMLSVDQEVNQQNDLPEEKQVYFFTFGMGQELAGHCQPILASDYGSARETMNELHDLWAFQYTEDEYLKLRKKGTANETLLEMIEGR